MNLLALGLFLALSGLQLSQAEEFTKCTGVNVGLTNICSRLAKMDCYNAGGGCCASYSDGTGTVGVAEKSSEEICGYCFTGQPGTLEAATLEAILTAQGKGKGRSGRRRNKGGSRGKGKRRRGGGRGKGKRRRAGGRGGMNKGSGAGDTTEGQPSSPPPTVRRV